MQVGSWPILVKNKLFTSFFQRCKLHTVKNNNTSKTRSSAKHRGKRTVKVDWAFRRLRNQAVRFFAAGDRVVRRELSRALEPARTYSQARAKIVSQLGARKGQRAWDQFMDTFFGHRINRHA